MEAGKTTTAIGVILTIITTQSPYIILFVIGLTVMLMSWLLKGSKTILVLHEEIKPKSQKRMLQLRMIQEQCSVGFAE
jgi:hypothetical protein